MNDAWRSLVSSDVIYKLATSKDVKKQHKAGKSLKVTGVIIKWLDYYSVIDDDMRFFSAYDSDGDGKLDYVTEGKMYFSDVANANLKKDGKNIGVGLIDIRPNTVKSVKNNVKLSELTELVL